MPGTRRTITTTLTPGKPTGTEPIPPDPKIE